MIRLAVAENYARALYQVSRERKIEEEVLSGLEFLEKQLQQESRIRDILVHPLVKKKDKKEIIKELFSSREKTPEEVINFLFLMVDKERSAEIEETVKQYRRQFQQKREIQVVEVYTPRELEEKQKDKIIENMQNYTGKKVVLEEKKNDSIKGGVILKVGSKMLDGSVDTRLRKMKEWLVHTG